MENDNSKKEITIERSGKPHLFGNSYPSCRCVKIENQQKRAIGYFEDQWVEETSLIIGHFAVPKGLERKGYGTESLYAFADLVSKQLPGIDCIEFYLGARVPSEIENSDIDRKKRAEGHEALLYAVNAEEIATQNLSPKYIVKGKWYKRDWIKKG